MGWLQPDQRERRDTRCEPRCALASTGRARGAGLSRPARTTPRSGAVRRSPGERCLIQRLRRTRASGDDPRERSAQCARDASESLARRGRDRRRTRVARSRARRSVAGGTVTRRRPRWSPRAGSPPLRENRAARVTRREERERSFPARVTVLSRTGGETRTGDSPWPLTRMTVPSSSSAAPHL